MILVGGNGVIVFQGAEGRGNLTRLSNLFIVPLYCSSLFIPVYYKTKLGLVVHSQDTFAKALRV